jgi:Putative zincin peptidase
MGMACDFSGITMQFKIGKPPEVASLIENANTLTINYKKIHLIGFLFSVATTIFVYLIWRIFLDNAVIFKIFDSKPLVFLGILAAIFITHEICHLLAHPQFGLSDSSCIGIYPDIWLPYAAYSGVMTRGRLLMILLSPILFLTLTPFMLFFYSSDATWAYVFAWCSICNASLSALDIYMSIRVLRIIPPRNFVHGHSYGATKKPPSYS